MENDSKSEVFGVYDFFIFVLSLYVLASMAVDILFDFNKDISIILETIDFSICIIFIVDFFYRLYSQGWKYLKWGWIDLLSSIPTIDVLRTGRIFRILRILRMLRGVRSSKAIIRFASKSRSQSTIVSVAIVIIAVMLFSSIAILYAEKSLAAANIKTAEDALWWAFITITSVGYGDRYPVSVEGKFVAFILTLVGMGLFGIVTGFMASWFVGEDTEKNSENDKIYHQEILHRISIIEKKIDSLSKNPGNE